MICQNCGNTLSDDAKFCSNCGASITQSESTVKASNAGEIIGDNKYFNSEALQDGGSDPNRDVSADDIDLSDLNNAYSNNAGSGYSYGSNAGNTGGYTQQQNQQMSYQQPSQQQNYYQQPPNNNMNGMENPGKTLAIASMVLGICGIVLPWIINDYSWIGIVCAIVGLVLSIISKQKSTEAGFEPLVQAKVGMILSIIALVMTVVLLIACLGCAGCAACIAASSYGS